MVQLPIASIELKNFMCHEKFQIEFNKPITCVVGRNGSGKSAIMIALGVLFGQRAKALERGNSYKSLIKEGTQCSTITVTINNYLKIPEYGNTIVLRRTIKEKTSPLEIKNNSKKFVPLKKHEIQKIVSTYKLNLSNPLNFLTQESAKKFLNVNSPKDLYEFYYVGTDFKAVEEELSESVVRLSEMQEKLKETKKRYEEIENKLKSERDNLEFVNIDYKESLKKAERELEWAGYFEMQKEVEEIEKTQREKESEIQNLQNFVVPSENDQNIVDAENRISELQNQIDSVLVDLKVIQNDYKDHQSEIITKKKEFDILKGKDNKEAVSLAYEKVKSDLKQISEYLSSFEREKEALDMQRFLERKENEENSRLKDSLKIQLKHLQNENSTTQNSDKTMKHDIIRKLIRPENTPRGKLTSQTKPSLRFIDGVIGPIGDYLKLSEQKWYKSASIILGSYVDQYIVFNIEDRYKLVRILKENNIDFKVITDPAKEICRNYRKSAYKTLLDILKCEDKLVETNLIYHLKIEQKILIENRKEAHEIIRSNPINTDCAYLPSGDRIKVVRGSMSEFRENEKQYYFFEDKNSKIKQINERIEQIKFSNEIEECQNKLSRKLKNLFSERTLLERKAKNLQVELSSYESVKDFDSSLIERKLMIMERVSKGLKDKQDKLESTIETLAAEKSRIEAENSKRKSEKKKRQDDLRNIQRENYVKIRMLSSKLDLLILKKKKLSDEMTNKRSYLGSLTHPRNKNLVEEEINSLRKRIARAEQMSSKDILKANISKLEKEKFAFGNIIEKFDGNLKEIENAIHIRTVKRDEIKTTKTEEAISLFRQYTKRSGYEGILTFDHELKKLEIQMKMPNAQKCGNKNTFSGGERSFAGVCFLLSLWKSFECPIKVLDEVDVFMDSINRKNAMKSIFDFVREVECQLILITPLDLSGLFDEICDIKLLTK